jgi:hypothetical protein
MEYRLGRLYAPDARDHGFPMQMAIRRGAAAIRSKYWWANGWWGNQGDKPECVAFAWTHWLEDGPITHKPKKPGGLGFDPDKIYHDAQKVDEWPGENYDGTSVRAGAKVLQAMGLIASYHWAFDVPTVVDAIKYQGPVVVGTNWYSAMFYPDPSGLISVGGTIAGGHAYLLDGVNDAKSVFRVKNSWGRDWGKKGFAFISYPDMERLISEQGEACLAIEIES